MCATATKPCTSGSSAPEACRPMQWTRLRSRQAVLRRSAGSTAAGGPALTPRRHALLASTRAALQAADVDATLSAAAGMMPAFVWLAAAQPEKFQHACKQAAPADGQHAAVHPWAGRTPVQLPSRAHHGSAHQWLRGSSSFVARHDTPGHPSFRRHDSRPFTPIAHMLELDVR